MEKQFSDIPFISDSVSHPQIQARTGSLNLVINRWLWILFEKRNQAWFSMSLSSAIASSLFALNIPRTFHYCLLLLYHSMLTGPFWENKTERALFRGRDSREERLHLVKLSKENPDLLDAGITGYFFFREKEKELGKVQLMGFFDFFKVASKLQSRINFAVKFLPTEKTRLAVANSSQLRYTGNTGPCGGRQTTCNHRQGVTHF